MSKQIQILVFWEKPLGIIKFQTPVSNTKSYLAVFHPTIIIGQYCQTPLSKLELVSPVVSWKVRRSMVRIPPGIGLLFFFYLSYFPSPLKQVPQEGASLTVCCDSNKKNMPSCGAWGKDWFKNSSTTFQWLITSSVNSEIWMKLFTWRKKTRSCSSTKPRISPRVKKLSKVTNFNFQLLGDLDLVVGPVPKNFTYPNYGHISLS